MNKKIFGSISSDNNVFDFGHIFRRTIKEMEITQEQWVEIARKHIHKKFGLLNELELSHLTVTFITGSMDKGRFMEAMDALGCKIEITVMMPEKPLKQKEEETGMRPPQFVFWDKSIADLNLTVRVENILKAENIERFGQLVALNENDVRRFVNMGKVGMERLKAAMREHGLDFGTDVQGWTPLDPDAKAANTAVLKHGIESLKMPQEVNNVLLHFGIYTLEQLCQLDERKLSALQDLTVRDHSLIVLALREKGLKLAPTLDAKGKEIKMASPFDRDIDHVLDIDVGTRNALHTFGFFTLGQLVTASEDTIRKLSGIGSTRFRRLVNDLTFMRLSLGMKIDWKPAHQA